jgi:hypothetical protein
VQLLVQFAILLTPSQLFVMPSGTAKSWRLLKEPPGGATGWPASCKSLQCNIKPRYAGGEQLIGAQHRARVNLTALKRGIINSRTGCQSSADRSCNNDGIPWLRAIRLLAVQRSHGPWLREWSSDCAMWENEAIQKAIQKPNTGMFNVIHLLPKHTLNL